MKKILFLDRDGTIIKEPPTDYQVDSFEKLAFLPKVLKYLGKIVEELDYELVMVTNFKMAWERQLIQRTPFGGHII